MTDTEGSDKVMIKGLQAETAAGSTLWVGVREDGDVLIKFINPENPEPETTIRVSHDGAITLLALLQDTFCPGVRA